MTKLISVIQDIIRIFQTYSEKDCSHSKLNKDELNLLIQNEFSEVIKNPKDPNTISSLLQILDENSDGEVDFNEFCDLLCKVLKAYYTVVYAKEDTCQQQDQPKKEVGTSSQTSDEPPKYYQKQLYPKSEKTQSTFHDQKGASCEDRGTGAETVQVSTQTDSRRAQPVVDHSSHKEPTIKIDETSSSSPNYQSGKNQTSHIDTTTSESKDYSYGKDQTSHQDTTTSSSKDYGKDQTSHQDTTTSSSTDYGYGKDQTSHQGTTSSSSQSYSHGKDQTSHQDTTSSSSQSYSHGKDQTSLQDTTGSSSQGYSQGKDQTSLQDTTGSSSQSYSYGKDQPQGTTNVQSTCFEKGKDHTSHSDTTSSTSHRYDQSLHHDNTSSHGKDQTSHLDTTGSHSYGQQGTTSSQSISYEQGKDQTSHLDTTGSQSNQYGQQSTTSSQYKQGDETALPEKPTALSTVEQPTQEGQSFYQQPLYIPPAQSFSREAHASLQPPSYSQIQQDPSPVSQQIPQEPQQPQQNKFYQYQQSFALQKKNP